MDKLPKQIIAENEYVEMALNNLKNGFDRKTIKISLIYHGKNR
ncbi:MAG: hypothetical protein WA440_03125 [Ignavibacteriaceae bacterium]